MYNITIVSSFHIELGKCNPHELYKIIETVHPEIIFEELSFDTFCHVYADGYIPNTIEAIAIKNYSRNYLIRHFPVDTYPIRDRDLFNGADEIAKKSNEYLKLWKEQLSMIRRDGYNFLNSNACMALLDEIRRVEETALLEINDIRLSHEYKSESELNDKREFEMLRNIYNYSKQYPYNKAMFICGADHRKTLKLKIRKQQNKEKLHLKWAFYNNV